METRRKKYRNCSKALRKSPGKILHFSFLVKNKKEPPIEGTGMEILTDLVIFKFQLVKNSSRGNSDFKQGGGEEKNKALF